MPQPKVHRISHGRNTRREPVWMEGYRKELLWEDGRTAVKATVHQRNTIEIQQVGSRSLRSLHQSSFTPRKKVSTKYILFQIFRNSTSHEKHFYQEVAETIFEMFTSLTRKKTSFDLNQSINLQIQIILVIKIWLL